MHLHFVVLVCCDSVHNENRGVLHFLFLFLCVKQKILYLKDVHLSLIKNKQKKKKPTLKPQKETSCIVMLLTNSGLLQVKKSFFFTFFVKH